MLAEIEDPIVIQPWLTGLNPELGGRIRLRLMKENDLETAMPEIMSAAPAFLVGGFDIIRRASIRPIRIATIFALHEILRV